MILEMKNADELIGFGDERRLTLKLGGATSVAMALGVFSGCNNLQLRSRNWVQGMVWQIDNQSVEPHGNWEKIGASTLLIQWVAVDGVSFVKGGEWPSAKLLPDWQRIARQPWAKNVILGLAGRSDELAARADAVNLVKISENLAKLPTPLNVVGWYFPLEIDSSWQDAAKLIPLLSRLPRPLWLSLYDSANVGAETLVSWLTRWLPSDIGIFFQDGVGVHARTAALAREHVDVLIRHLGRAQVRIIAEAFRPKTGGGFRSATADELRVQLQAYQGLPVYLFDGPHYVSEALVDELC